MNKHKEYARNKTKCAWCEKTIFKTDYEVRNYKHHFCNQKCHGKWTSKNNRNDNNPLTTRKKVLCNYCRKPVIKQQWQLKQSEHYFCNHGCFGKWYKDNFQGKNNSLWDSIEIPCSYCKKPLFINKCRLKYHKHFFCNMKCFKKWLIVTEFYKGENNPLWNNGSSFEPYGYGFNRKLKDFIRKRDGYRCQNPECGVPQEECLHTLHVHHINYDKNNNNSINLITLCHLCNNKANFNRDYWRRYYQKIQIKRKVHLYVFDSIKEALLKIQI